MKLSVTVFTPFSYVSCLSRMLELGRGIGSLTLSRAADMLAHHRDLDLLRAHRALDRRQEAGHPAGVRHVPALSGLLFWVLQHAAALQAVSPAPSCSEREKNRKRLPAPFVVCCLW